MEKIKVVLLEEHAPKKCDGVSLKAGEVEIPVDTASIWGKKGWIEMPDGSPVVVSSDALTERGVKNLEIMYQHAKELDLKVKPKKHYRGAEGFVKLFELIQEGEEKIERIEAKKAKAAAKKDGGASENGKSGKEGGNGSGEENTGEGSKSETGKNGDGNTGEKESGKDGGEGSHQDSGDKE